MAHKLMVIGLDGAPFPLLQRWTEEGYLPNLARLIKRGSFGILRSTLPVHSPTAWASFMTGVNPGKHGVFDFAQRADDSYQLQVVRADHIYGATIWRVLSDDGKRVAVINVPMTYPPEPVNGFLISGLGTPDYTTYTYPPELSETLSAAGYRVNKRFFFDPQREEEWLDDIFDMTERRGQAAVKLLEQNDWDFAMVVFRNTDEICHFYWHHMDESHPFHDPQAPARHKNAIRDLYMLADKWVGELVEVVGDDTNIIVMSDHGAGPLYKDVFLNEWLWANDWLHLRDEGGSFSISNLARRAGITRKMISDTLSRLRLQRIEFLIKKVLGERIYVLPRDERPEFMNAVDWSKTVAFSFGYYGQIYVNLKGREPEGVVESGASYIELRDAIAHRLRTLVDPEDGQPVIDQVFTKEELYDGPQLDHAPDLLAIMRDFSYITRKGYEFAEERGTIFAKPYTQETGSHRLEGVLIAAGPDLNTVPALKEHQIQDLAPTILHLLHTPIPDYMDGKLISEMITPEFMDTHRPSYVDVPLPDPAPRSISWSLRDEEDVTDQLKKLGYLG